MFLRARYIQFSKCLPYRPFDMLTSDFYSFIMSVCYLQFYSQTYYHAVCDALIVDSRLYSNVSC